MRYYSGLGTFGCETDLGTYLTRIAMNLSLNRDQVPANAMLAILEPRQRRTSATSAG